MRRKRLIRNVIYGMVENFVTIILGIIIPRLLIMNYGSEVNGLLSSITNVFVYLNLLEAGVGGSARQALYKPIVERDQKQINGILSAMRYYYLKTGKTIALASVVLAFIYPFIVQSDIPYSTIVILVLLNAAVPLINYFFQGKYNALLMSDNRSYVLSWFNTVAVVLTDVLKIIAMMLGVNILLVQCIAVFVTILRVLFFYRLYIKRHYQNVSFYVTPDFDKIRSKNALFIIQLKTVVFNNVDILMLTMFSDLKTVSIYSVYSLIYRGISSVPATIYKGVSATLGQLYAKKAGNFRSYYERFEGLYNTVVFILLTVTFLMITPFIKMYTSGSDIAYQDERLSYLFFAVQILINLRFLSDRLIYIAGHFQETQRQATIEMLMNILLSLLLVQRYDIYGVLLATCITLFYRSIELTIYTSRKIIRRNPLLPMLQWFLNTMLAIGIIITINKHYHYSIEGVVEFMYFGVMFTLAISIVHVVKYSIVGVIKKVIRKIVRRFEMKRIHQVGDKIGHGSCSEIYSLSTDHLLKLLNSGESEYSLRQEYKNNKFAEGAGLTVPKAIRMVRYKGRPGIVYERLNGISYLELCMQEVNYIEPSLEKIDHYTRKMANLLAEVHSKSGEGLSSQRETMLTAIRNVPYLAEGVKDSLRNFIESKPLERQLCHGDANFTNFMFVGESTYLIDWTNASSGDPKADVAEMLSEIKFADYGKRMDTQAYDRFNLLRPRIYNVFLEEYVSVTKQNKEQIEDWFVPITARRLSAQGLTESETEQMKKAILE